MRQWEQGCQIIQGELLVCAEDVLPHVATPGFCTEHAESIPLQQALWISWSHHWECFAKNEQTAQIEGGEVLRRIRQGRLTKVQLPADLMRDVALAWSAGQGDSRAIGLLTHQHTPLAAPGALAVFSGLQRDPNWQDEFLAELIASPSGVNKIERFQGKCSLQLWLNTVARNWAFDQRRKHLRAQQRAQGERLTEQPEVADAVNSLMTMECRQLWEVAIQHALAALHASQRYLLIALYAEARSGKEVAAMLQIHPGNVSRQKKEAEANLATLLQTQLQEQQSLADCAEHLLESSADFASVWVDAMRASPPTGGAP